MAVAVTVFAGLLYEWGFQPASADRVKEVNQHSGAVTYVAATPPPDLGGASMGRGDLASLPANEPVDPKLTRTAMIKMVASYTQARGTPPIPEEVEREAVASRP